MGPAAVEMSRGGYKTKPMGTTISKRKINQFPGESLKTEEQSELKHAQAKAVENQKVKIKEYSSQDKSGMVCHVPTLWAFMNCNRKNLSKKFKTLGILEVGIKYTSNQEKSKTLLSPYQNSSLYL